MTPEWIAPIGRLLDREGPGREHLNDLGGPTRYGMTLATYRSITKRPDATEEELRGLSRESIGELYWRHWVRHPRLMLDEMPSMHLAEVVLDSAVLFGRARAARWLQIAINEHLIEPGRSIKVDGWLGARTCDAVTRTFGFDRLAAHMLRSRIERHAERVRADPSQAVFIVGWVRRAFDVCEPRKPKGDFW